MRVSMFREIQNTNNLEIQFGLEEPQRLYLLCLNILYIFDIFFDVLKVQRTCYFISGNDYTLVLNMNKVGHYI